jgi:hypothetical protein
VAFLESLKTKANDGAAGFSQQRHYLLFCFYGKNLRQIL